MRGASTLIPARFLSLIGHLCVVITLLWESKVSVSHCLPSHHHQNYLQIYHNRLVVGCAVSLSFILLELATFISGLTMFSPTVSLISVAGHGSASILLTYFVLDGWLCDWFWPIFVICTVMPFLFDIFKMLMKILWRIFTTNEHEQLTKTQEYTAGWSPYLVLAGVATTFGSSLPFGYHIGVVNTPAEIIKTFCNESFATRYDVHLNDAWMNVLWSSIVSIFIVGGCAGSVMGAYMANALGRRRATMATSLMSLCGAALFLSCRAANSVELLILGRLIVGLASGLTMSIVPMYLTELAPAPLAGALGVACPMGVNVGVLVGQLMGLDSVLGGVDDWPYLLAVYSLLVVVCLPALYLLPESPKYLFVVRKNEELAIRELSRLRGVSASVLRGELDVLREEAEAEAEAEAAAGAGAAGGARWSMVRVLRDRRLRLPLLLACSMQAGQQTSGINAVFYYSQTIFRQAGLSVASAQHATIGCGLINVCTAAWMVRLVPRAGRRPLLLASTLGAALLLAALAAAMRCIDAVSWMPYVCMVAVFSYVLVYGLGLGPIPYFIASELFEVGPRPAGMAWGSLANWGGNFLVGMSFPSMRRTIGPYSFLLFAATTGALYVFQRFYLPETRGKTPAHVTQLCGHGLRSRPLLSTVEANGDA